MALPGAQLAAARSMAAPLLLRAAAANGMFAAPPGLQMLAAAAAMGCRGLATAAGTADAPTGAASGSSTGPQEWPVIIAGGGPTGLTTALLLAKYGVRSLVLEKARTLTDHPQARLAGRAWQPSRASWAGPARRQTLALPILSAMVIAAPGALGTMHAPAAGCPPCRRT